MNEAFLQGLLEGLEKQAVEGQPLGLSIGKKHLKDPHIGQAWRDELAAKLKRLRKIDPLWARERALPALRKDYFHPVPPPIKKHVWGGEE